MGFRKSNPLKPQSTDQIIQGINNNQKAEISRSKDLRSKWAFRQVIPLDSQVTAQNPYIIRQPYRGIYVESTSSSGVSVRFSTGSLDDYNAQNYVFLKQNDSFFAEYEETLATLTWDSQPGQSISIVLFLEVDFKPGTQLVNFSGGVTESTGSVVESLKLGSSANVGKISIPAATFTLVVAGDGNRKQMTLYFDGPVWLGDINVAPGVAGIFFPGGIYEFKNQGALYASAVSGTVTAYGNYEF